MISSIILQNNTASSIAIQDLGLTLEANAIKNISLFLSLEAIAKSNQLFAQISSGNITLIYDGSPIAGPMSFQIKKAPIFSNVVVRNGNTNSSAGIAMNWPDGVATTTRPFILPIACAIYSIQMYHNTAGAGMSWSVTISYSTNGGASYISVPGSYTNTTGSANFYLANMLSLPANTLLRYAITTTGSGNINNATVFTTFIAL